MILDRRLVPCPRKFGAVARPPVIAAKRKTWRIFVKVEPGLEESKLILSPSVLACKGLGDGKFGTIARSGSHFVIRPMMESIL